VAKLEAITADMVATEAEAKKGKRAATRPGSRPKAKGG